MMLMILFNMMKKRLIPVIVVTITAIIILVLLNPSKKLNKMMISEAEWENIVSSRTMDNSLTIDMIIFNDYVQIVNNSNNIIYYSIVNSSVSKYNPSVKYRSSKKANLVMLNDEIKDENINSPYFYKWLLYNDTSYHLYYLKCTDLPLLNIEYDPDLDDGSDSIPMKLTLFNNMEDSTNRVTISDGKLKILSNGIYKFSLKMLTPGKNVRRNKRSILDMDPNSEYKLSKEIEDAVEQNEFDDFNDGNGKDNKIELFINDEYGEILYFWYKYE